MSEELEIIFKQFSKDMGGSLAAIDYMLNLRNQFSSSIISNIMKSKSQIGQDIFVLTETNFKKNGFFVEFGAASGIELSNTYLLEKEFKWNGILAEPGVVWHDSLQENRRCWIDTNCVWKSTGAILPFNQTSAPEYSTIDQFSSSDGHSELRKNGTSYNVSTISLLDLLKKYDAPKAIDYLSVDTEGSEYEILKNFDFDEYQFKVITCEHNFTPSRDDLFSLLTSKGYVRKFEELSKFDDWYVKEEI